MPTLHPGKPGHAQMTTRMFEAVQGVAAGKSQVEIAKHLGISQPAVSKLLRKANDILYREIRETLNAYKVSQTQSYLWMYREATAAWERSKTPRQRIIRSTKKKLIVDADGKKTEIDEPTEQRTEVLQSHGDVNYLAMADRALGAMRRIWGLDAPVKVQAQREPTVEEQLTDAELLMQMQHELADMTKRATLIEHPALEETTE